MLWIIIYSGFVFVNKEKRRRRESKPCVVSICLLSVHLMLKANHGERQ